MTGNQQRTYMQRAFAQYNSASTNDSSFFYIFIESRLRNFSLFFARFFSVPWLSSRFLDCFLSRSVFLSVVRVLTRGWALLSISKTQSNDHGGQEVSCYVPGQGALLLQCTHTKKLWIFCFTFLKTISKYIFLFANE